MVMCRLVRRSVGWWMLDVGCWMVCGVAATRLRGEWVVVLVVRQWDWMIWVGFCAWEVVTGKSVVVRRRLFCAVLVMGPPALRRVPLGGGIVCEPVVCWVCCPTV